jgi:hypothetical protein
MQRRESVALLHDAPPDQIIAADRRSQERKKEGKKESQLRNDYCCLLIDIY